MSIQLPPDVEASIRRKVQRGQFPDEGEVVREAIRLLDEREFQLDVLRAKIRVGLDQLDRGEGIEMTDEAWDDLDREVDDRLRRGVAPNPDVIP
ncbi:MAG: antitoxin ParD1/3/4 [Thermomicrobiales bacterium]|jgi:antitoxin ParD1/3/4|nr:antitoxin ParD1/3/4 [Thermomicrobiales bacterium]